MAKNALKHTNNESRIRLPIIISVLSLIIALGSLAITGYTAYQIYFKSSINVIASRQIRLYCLIDRMISVVHPSISMSLIYANDGGRMATVLDTKIKVKWKVGGRTVLYREFIITREVENLLYESNEVKQFPVMPVAVLGRSTVSKQYIFVPLEHISQSDIPRQFDLEMELLILHNGTWEQHSKYISRGIENIWQDISSGPPFRSNVFDIEKL